MEPSKPAGSGQCKVCRHGSLLCMVKGNQITFKDTEKDENFHRNLNYIVDTEKFQRSHRRIRSLEARIGATAAGQTAQQDNVGLNDILIDVDHGKEEQKNVRCLTESPRLTSRNKSRWSVVRTVVHAITLFRTNEAQKINNDVCRAKKKPIGRAGQSAEDLPEAAEGDIDDNDAHEGSLRRTLSRGTALRADRHRVARCYSRDRRNDQEGPANLPLRCLRCQ